MTAGLGGVGGVGGVVGLRVLAGKWLEWSTLAPSLTRSVSSQVEDLVPHLLHETPSPASLEVHLLLPLLLHLLVDLDSERAGEDHLLLSPTVSQQPSVQAGSTDISRGEG